MTKSSLAPTGRAKIRLMRTNPLRYRMMALAVIALVLAMKALVPAGYMVDSASKAMTIHVCADAQFSSTVRDILVPMKSEPAGKHSKAEGMCPYTALSLASLGGADPFQLALALLFILAMGFATLGRDQADLRLLLKAQGTRIEVACCLGQRERTEVAALVRDALSAASGGAAWS